MRQEDLGLNNFENPDAQALVRGARILKPIPVGATVGLGPYRLSGTVIDRRIDSGIECYDLVEFPDTKFYRDELDWRCSAILDAAGLIRLLVLARDGELPKLKREEVGLKPEDRPGMTCP